MRCRFLKRCLYGLTVSAALAPTGMLFAGETPDTAPLPPALSITQAATADPAKQNPERRPGDSLVERVALDVAGSEPAPLPRDLESMLNGAAGQVTPTAHQLPSVGLTDPQSPPALESAPTPSDLRNAQGMPSSEPGFFDVASFQPPPAPVQPPPAIQPTVPTVAPTTEGIRALTAPGGSFSTLVSLSRAEAAGPAASGLSAEQVKALPVNNTADALKDAGGVQAVQTIRRSAVSVDPTIRGYKFSQIYAESNGTYWTPIRPDLDSMLSKVDPAMIQDVVIIPGPYGLRYGPGFAFIDIERELTPRYESAESHLCTTAGIRANGAQFYGRETVYGGNQDWGFRFSYGDRQGTDYRGGTRGSEPALDVSYPTTIPGSFHARDVIGELGYSLTADQRVEFSFQRLDQTGTDYPCQLFNLPYLGSYNFETRVIDTDPTARWSRLEVAAWYNSSRYYGLANNGAANDNDVNFPVLSRVNAVLALAGYDGGVTATTRGSLASAGTRAIVTFGEKDEQHINAGVDFRYVSQAIVENYDLWNGGIPQPITSNTPHASMADPGMYAEWFVPLSDSWTTSVGGRVDFVHTCADPNQWRGQGGGDTSLPDPYQDPSPWVQRDTLVAFYWNNSIKLDDQLTVEGGGGYAQRPPSLTERYADGLAMSMFQSGLNRVVGTPTLKPESDWQVDLGLKANYENFRGKLAGYYAWVNDYATVSALTVGSPVPLGDARYLVYTNTDLATLTGFEAGGEYDVGSNWTAFGTMGYVQGTDQQIHRPLPGISPLASVVGLRVHDSDHGKKWGIEGGARMVHRQALAGWVRYGASDQILIEEQTPGFTVCHLRSYYNYTKNLTFTAGIENLFDRRYQEHTDLRLSGPTNPPTSYTGWPYSRVLQPGFTPYFGMEWIY